MTLQDSLARGKRRKAVKETALNKNPQDRRGLWHCNYCQKDISSVPRIKCAICKDFDLCLECFSVGVEITPHKNEHDYQVIENLSFPLYHPDWGVDEEVLLLEAIDQLGLGNWAAIADHVGGKTAEQSKLHYYQVYIDAPSHPLPTPAPEMALIDLQQYMNDARSGLPRRRWLGEGSANGNAADDDTNKGSRKGAVAAKKAGQDGAKGAAGENAQEAQAAGTEEPAGQADPHQHAQKGVKRPRGSLDDAPGTSEQAKDAAGAHVTTGGRSVHHDPLDPASPSQPRPPVAAAAAADASAKSKAKPTGAPDAVGYNAKREEFDPEYDNDAESVVADMEFSEQDTPEDVAIKVKMLQIYNRRLDEREQRRLFVLQHGLLNTKAAQLLERRRNTQERELHAAMRVFTRYTLSQAAHDEMVEGLLLEARMRSRIAELQQYRRNGIRTFANADIFDTERRRAKATGGAAGGADAAMTAAGGTTAGPGGAAGNGLVPGSLIDPTKPAASLNMGRGAAQALVAWRLKRGVPLDISALPGVELLSGRERELCAAARLLPPHYLALKEMFLRDAEQHGSISRQEARSYFRLDPPRTLRIYDLQVAAGWLKSDAKGGAGAAGGGQGGGGTSQARSTHSGGDVEGNTNREGGQQQQQGVSAAAGGSAVDDAGEGAGTAQREAGAKDQGGANGPVVKQEEQQQAAAAAGSGDDGGSGAAPVDQEMQDAEAG